MAPFLLLALALLVADIRHRRNPEQVDREIREAEEERAERELDEILRS